MKDVDTGDVIADVGDGEDKNREDVDGEGKKSRK